MSEHIFYEIEYTYLINHLYTCKKEHNWNRNSQTKYNQIIFVNINVKLLQV